MTRNKVLIISGELDSTADGMARCLKRMHAAFERFHPKDFPTKSRVDLTISSEGAVSGGVAGPGVAFRWEEVGSVWYRRPEPYYVPESLSTEEKEFAVAESGAALSGAWRIHDALWVNHPDRNRVAESKALQLTKAQRLGLPVPKTLFTNDPLRLVQFYDETGGSLIYKTMTQGILGGEKMRSVYTSRVTKEHLRQVHLLANGPGLFQELIPKACDLRITVIGDRVFAVAIDAEPDDRANMDWRRFDTSKLKHTPHRMPQDIERRCLELTREFGLQYAAIDMILTPQGEYVFLEVNPNGQYGWIEDVTDLPLTETLAELLVTGTAQASGRSEAPAALLS